MTTPICDHPLDNDFADAVRRSGLRCDSREELVEFLDAMMKAFDQVAEAKQRQATAAPHVADALMERDILLAALESTGSMIDACVLLDVDLADAPRILSCGKPTPMELWDEMRWIEVEALLMEDEWSIRTLAVEADVSPNTARRLLDWYSFLAVSPL